MRGGEGKMARGGVEREVVPIAPWPGPGARYGLLCSALVHFVCLAPDSITPVVLKTRQLGDYRSGLQPDLLKTCRRPGLRLFSVQNLIEDLVLRRF